MYLNLFLSVFPAAPNTAPDVPSGAGDKNTFFFNKHTNE